MPKTTDRPLVVRCGAFGDMVLITALIDELSARFGSEVDLVTSGPWSTPLLRGQPGVGKIFNVRSRKMPFWMSRDQQRVVRELRSRGVGPTWLCDGNDAARSMISRAGIPASYIVDVKEHPRHLDEHATEQWRRLAGVTPRAILERGSPAPLAKRFAAPTRIVIAGQSAAGCRLEVNTAQRQDLAEWLERRRISPARVIAIQAGNKRTFRRGLKRLAHNPKYWPNERWARVLKHLRARHPSHAILLLGAGPEFGLNDSIAALAPIDGLHNVADDLPVPRLAALLSIVDGLISVDSGPAHVAAAVDCPQVVLFGEASVSLYRPLGSNGAETKVLTGLYEGAPSMLGISVQDVVQAWDRLRLRAV